MKENDKEKMKPELNLQRLCMLKIATSIWNKDETKQQIAVFFDNFFPSNDDCLLYENWNQQLTSNLLAFLHNCPLSLSSRANLKNTITITGLQICHWKKFVVNILELNIDESSDIFWTNYGTIDKKKIFLHWHDKRQLKYSKLFNIACILCFEDYIPNLWEKIPEDERFNQFYMETIYTSSEYNVIAYWKNLLQVDSKKRYTIGIQNENLKKKFSWYQFCNNSQSIEETMFRISMMECLEMAVKYFWEKLSDDERKTSVRTLIKTNYSIRDETEFARILFFLSTKLSRERSEEYFLVQSILMKNYSVQDFFYASVGSCFSIL
ncbi:uncharacterized protein LOC122510099 [Leptopilina heterotoma]|uniref:uncharacterized protein LOC122510099 n=1 Tax=Leptopilina heterotoma TaxID=63436 RepID=UPI001CA91495|nr:uncharacterized protein LOC122510099 [Leptopilina heterotoma]